MDDTFHRSSPADGISGQPFEDSSLDLQIDDPKNQELSSEYVGRWSQLISTTNWEKGRIILQWRETLLGAQTAPGAYSDEAWSRRVGGVSPQHVGRLRRVCERFGDSYESYPGLYWSHFLAALDWDDAELWLEGASRSQWSVAQMRHTRWQANGGDPQAEPRDNVVMAEPDEDYQPLSELENGTGAQDGTRGVAEGPRPDGPDFGDEFDGASGREPAESLDDDSLPWESASSDAPLESPFANLPSLPVDLAEALEQFKLAIIRHRANAWAEVDRAHVLQALDALKAFAAL